MFKLTVEFPKIAEFNLSQHPMIREYNSLSEIRKIYNIKGKPLTTGRAELKRITSMLRDDIYSNRRSIKKLRLEKVDTD